MREKAEALVRQQETEHLQRQVERKRRVMEAQIAALQAGFQSEKEEMEKLIAQQKLREMALQDDRKEMEFMRGANGGLE
jgi:circadian clock protein KaiC